METIKENQEQELKFDYKHSEFYNEEKNNVTKWVSSGRTKVFGSLNEASIYAREKGSYFYQISKRYVYSKRRNNDVQNIAATEISIIGYAVPS